jgi:SAM-dependent methyltransferase
LAGQHFSMLLSPTQERIARYHINERRAGTRSAHQLELYVLGKGSGGQTERVTLMQLTAKGLYDERHRYLGTVGLLRDLSAQREHLSKMHALETRLQEVDRELAASRDAAFSSQHLQQPLSALLQDSQRLLTALQSIHFDQHVKQLAANAAQATEVGYEVWKAVQFRGRPTHSVSLNNILHEVLTALSQERSLLPQAVEQRLGRMLPGIAAHPQEIKELFRILILYAVQAPAGTSPGHRLLLETYVLKVAGTAAPSSPIVSAPLTPYVVTVIREEPGGGPSMTVLPSAPRVSGSDLLRVYDIVRQHGGSIEIGSVLGPSVHIMVRLPAAPTYPVVDLPKPPVQQESAPIVLPFPTAPSPAQANRPDRRRSARIRLRVPLELSIGAIAWQGTILDIGLGGMFVALPQLTPPIEYQPVYLIIRTSVSFLELQGTVRYRSAGSSGEMHPSSFIIEFTPLTKPEAAVLTSLIHSLQEPSAGFTFEGLIPDTAERARLSSTIPSRQERRWHVRTRVVRPVHLILSRDQGTESVSGVLVNLGQGGACIQIAGLSEAVAASLAVQSPAFHRIIVADESIPDGLPAQIVWATQPAAADETRHVGVSFHRLSVEAEERLNGVLASRFISPLQLEQNVDGDKSGTTLVLLHSCHDGSLVISYDRLTDQVRENSPILIISPGYAQTRVDYLGLASEFKRHGCRILRYDSTHAMGLSDGDPRAVTLESLKDDLKTVVELAQERWPGAPLVILASDLSARASLKLFAQGKTADLLLLLDPILDLQRTLHDLHHRDLVEDRKAGLQLGLLNLMGLAIDADRFLDDAVEGRYVNFSSVQNDIRELRCHVRFVTTPAADRTFARPTTMEDGLIQQLIEMLGERAATISLSAPVVGEELTSERHRETCHALIMQCKEMLSSRWPTFDPALESDLEDISTRSRHEIAQLRLKSHVAPWERFDLWTRYTQHSSVFSEIPSYLQHFNDLYQTIHPFRTHQNILDVGCSHYGFARLWLLNEFYRSSASSLTNRSGTGYIGIDLHLNSVRSARDAFMAVRRQGRMVSAGIPAIPPSVSSRWIVGDAISFPFGNELFDCIVGHFVLSFSPNPAVALRELYRLLRPNGTLMVSCLTPATDLAFIYRAHLNETRQDGLSGIHRNLLLDLATLYESIRCRRLHSFTKQTLASLFDQMTAQSARIFPSLDNHVLIATVQKPDSARWI